MADLRWDPSVSRNSLALANLRGVVILVVVAFHAASAYLGSLPQAAYRFDEAPYLWTAFPIVDRSRWLGLDLLCAWQDVYLMCLMFFLSALFAWSSLSRKGAARFVGDRALRLGVPYLFGALVVMPAALYPVYRVTAVDPSVAAYLSHLFALPFWPNGPMWFLWQLLALSLAAAGVYRFAPGLVAYLARKSSSADLRPGKYVLWVAAACIAAYLPLALAFSPLSWADRGPVSIQFSRILIYFVAYLAGLGVGAAGLEAGLLAPNGELVRHWARWLVGATAAYFLWIAFAAFGMRPGVEAPLWLQAPMDVSYAIACVAGWFGALALCLRFGAVRSPILRSLSDNAFGIYVVHYGFVVWLQYALLGLAAPAIVKALMVFAGSLLLSWGTVCVLRFVPFGLALVGGERTITQRARDQNRACDGNEAPPESRFPQIVR
jgi:surface polysaccharide O-acyltransferase-like enzyme